MDFTKILDAIDIIVNQKLSEAAFTRFINGTIIEIVNSEQNTYKVTTDGGKSNFIAQAVAADIDGGIVYEKDDEVKLLQLNGSNNSNENIYILGHSADFTKQDLNEIKSYFIKSESVTLGTSSENIFVIEEEQQQKLFDDIKQKCSFGLSANVKTPFGLDGLPLADYGFEIQFLDESNKILLTYKLNVNNMVGEPYKFTDFVPQKIERYITNPTIVSQIKKIKILINGLQSDEYNSLEIYSAIWTQDTNDYQVTFKNPTRVDYITDKENDKTKFSLQAILLKNNKTFATNTCKYLWFKKNMSVTQGGDGYSFYGGEGWELLNEVEDITYLDINQIERTDRVIKNNIGNTYIIDKDKATMYHNYYKCVVLYNDLKIESETKHILNIDAAGDVNLRLGQTVGEATAAQVIEPNETINTFTEDGFYLGFVFNAVADISKYRVTIVRKTDQDDSETTYIFSTNPNAEKGEKQIYSLDGKYYGTIKQDYSNSYAAYMYVCSVASEVEENKFTLLESVEKSYYVEGGEVREIIQYYDNGTSAVMPTNYVESNWVDNYTKIENWESKYIIGRKKLSNVVNAKWEYFWFMVLGSEQSAAQLEEFNKLTKNGIDRGLYYGEGHVPTEDKIANEDKTYYIYDSDAAEYKVWNRQANEDFNPNTTYYEYKKNALFFNADYINTGSLRVGNGKQTKFFADVKNKDVQIGGFKVDNTSFTGGTPKSFKLVDDYCNNFSKTSSETDLKIIKESDEYFTVELYSDKNFSCYTQDYSLNRFLLRPIKNILSIYYDKTNKKSFGEEITDLPTDIKILAIPSSFFTGSNTETTNFSYQIITTKQDNYRYFKLILGNYDSDDYIYIGQNGLELGNAFSILTTGNATINAGYIGGIGIDNNGMTLSKNKNIQLNIATSLTESGLNSSSSFSLLGGRNEEEDGVGFIFAPNGAGTYQYGVKEVYMRGDYDDIFGGTDRRVDFYCNVFKSFQIIKADPLNPNLTNKFVADIQWDWTIWYQSAENNYSTTKTAKGTCYGKIDFYDQSMLQLKDYFNTGDYRIRITYYKFTFDITYDSVPFTKVSQSFNYSSLSKKNMTHDTYTEAKKYRVHYSEHLDSGSWSFGGFAGDAEMENGETFLTFLTQPEKKLMYTQCRGDLIPEGNNKYLFGHSDTRWKEIWCTQSSINSPSDRNLKKDIQLLPTEYDLLYDKLEPVRYKFIQNESDRYHVGFISQDVEEALKLANLTSKDFAGFVKTKKEDSEDEFDYGLRYGEFIALNTDQIQKLKKRVLLLEQEIKEIKGEDNNETL